MKILILSIPDADQLQAKRMELEMAKIKQKELALGLQAAWGKP